MSVRKLARIAIILLMKARLMAQEHFDEHLSRISTIWTMVYRAHRDNPPAIRVAQTQLMDRYSGAVYRYLARVLGNLDAADEVFQEFALQFVRGGFRHADPTRGRFRDYLKISLLRLVSNYRRRLKYRLEPLQGDAADVVGAEATAALDEAFVASCRDELLLRTWQRLKAADQQRDSPLFDVLDYRAHHPDTNATEMARALTEQLRSDRPLTAVGVRKMLQRARQEFAQLLLDEVAQTLPNASAAAIEEEVIDLGLHSYCRDALNRRHAR
jgi:RNA polymerase sigma-70 factor (ECF subfamily)